MKKRGLGIIGIIVLIGLIALIVWGLNYITTKDFVTVRTPLVTAPITMPTNIAPTSTPVTVPNTVSTTTVTPTKVATPTPTKTAAPAPAKKVTPAPTTPAPTTPPTIAALTVTFTDKGFSPTSLSVKKGQTVKFVNNSSGKMWVAANPFPTSSEYPAFNEKAGAAVGATWSFTFTQIGTWYYHNHYAPAQGAKIIVSP